MVIFPLFLRDPPQYLFSQHFPLSFFTVIYLSLISEHGSGGALKKLEIFFIFSFPSFTYPPIKVSFLSSPLFESSGSVF